MDRIKISFNSMEAWGARDIATSGESWGKNSTNRVLNGLRFSCVYLCACVFAIPKCCFPLFMGFSWVVQCWFLNTLLCVLSSFSKKNTQKEEFCWSMHSGMYLTWYGLIVHCVCFVLSSIHPVSHPSLSRVSSASLKWLLRLTKMSSSSVKDFWCLLARLHISV